MQSFLTPRPPLPSSLSVTLLLLQLYPSILSFVHLSRGPYAAALGKFWHPEHFTCTKCCKQLSNQTFVVEGDEPYCEPCYEKSVAPMCEECKHTITGVTAPVCGVRTYIDSMCDVCVMYVCTYNVCMYVCSEEPNIQDTVEPYVFILYVNCVATLFKTG